VQPKPSKLYADRKFSASANLSNCTYGVIGTASEGIFCSIIVRGLFNSYFNMHSVAGLFVGS
jgi:hypothetical protein